MAKVGVALKLSELIRSRGRYGGGHTVDDRTGVAGQFRNLESYCLRRLHLAGGGLWAEEAVDHNPLHFLKSLYLQPLDELKSDFERSGKTLVSFGNYDYAGLASDRRIKQAGCDAIMAIGLGAGASRLVGGERSVHGALEKDLAGFLGVDDTIALVSGYMTNVSLVGHLLTGNDLIVVDELSHNSIIVGSDVSRARVVRFAHNDLAHLDSILRQVRHEASRVLIIVEGLYSMDGDVANLPRLLEIRDRYEAWLMVDEAHSIGVLGPNGRGLAEHFGIDPRSIDIIVGTMSKTFAACGGFVGGRRGMTDWLRFTLPAFVFSVGISPAIAAAVRQGIQILQTESWRVARLQQNSRHFLEQARMHGLNVGPAIGAGVVSILFSNQHECALAAQGLLDAGYFAPPILQLAVPKDKPRIRFFISADHTETQIAGVVESLTCAITRSRSPRQHQRRRVAKGRLGMPSEASVAS